VEALADAVGFRYAYDAKTGEYAHNAANVLLSPTGKVTRYLYGIDFDPDTVKLGLLEASNGTIGSAFDRFLITCYEYDEDAQSYSLAVMTVTKIGGVLLLLVFGGLLLFFWRRESRQDPDGWADAHPAPTP
jgi:protein SCO1/2